MLLFLVDDVPRLGLRDDPGSGIDVGWLDAMTQKLRQLDNRIEALNVRLLVDRKADDPLVDQAENVQRQIKTRRGAALARQLLVSVELRITTIGMAGKFDFRGR